MSMTMMKYVWLYLIGGFGYGLIEMLFRGHTHWTMIAAGGVCFLLIYLISIKSAEPLWKKWIMGGAVITTVEFVTGGIVNILLGWNVWSYAHHRLNLMGQISLLFFCLWVFLSVPGMWLCALLRRKLFGVQRDTDR
jgi:uncharacterized membrane protein